jgi:VCBS repeat-containing protein
VSKAAGVLHNDVDKAWTPLTARKVTGPAHGTLVLNADGSFRYVPRAGFTGQDSFTYVADDGSQDSKPATVTLWVKPIKKGK